MRNSTPGVFEQFVGHLQLFSQLGLVCHRLEHEVGDERGADLIGTSLPEDASDAHPTEQHCPDEQLATRLVQVLYNRQTTSAHRTHSVRAAYSHKPSSVVCPSVSVCVCVCLLSTTVNPAKRDEPTEMTFGV